MMIAEEVIHVTFSINNRILREPFIKLKHRNKAVVSGTPFCMKYDAFIDLFNFKFNSSFISTNAIVREVAKDDAKPGLIMISDMPITTDDTSKHTHYPKLDKLLVKV